MDNYLLRKLPNCPERDCVRKRHAPGQGVHVGADGRVWTEGVSPYGNPR